MKDTYVTITGFWHYYGVKPFKIGKVLKCVKEPSNPYDEDAIKVVIKEVGTVGYIANSIGFKATWTASASKIHDKVKKKFWVEVMFITSSKVICKVVDGFKELTVQDSCSENEEAINIKWYRFIRIELYFGGYYVYQK